MAIAILTAIKKGDFTLASKLLRNQKLSQIDLNIQDKDEDGTALFWSSSKGLLDIVQLLLAAGADTDMRNSWGATPLHGAADNNHDDVVRLLIKYGANINSQTYAGDTAAHLGAYRGYLDVVKILVDNGSDVWIMNVSGHDVIQEAQSKGQSHIVKYIRDKEFQGRLPERPVRTPSPETLKVMDYPYTISPVPFHETTYDLSPCPSPKRLSPREHSPVYRQFLHSSPRMHSHATLPAEAQGSLKHVNMNHNLNSFTGDYSNVHGCYGNCDTTKNKQNSKQFKSDLENSSVSQTLDDSYSLTRHKVPYYGHRQNRTHFQPVINIPRDNVNIQVYSPPKTQRTYNSNPVESISSNWNDLESYNSLESKDKFYLDKKI